MPVRQIKEKNDKATNGFQDLQEEACQREETHARAVRTPSAWVVFRGIHQRVFAHGNMGKVYLGVIVIQSRIFRYEDPTPVHAYERLIVAYGYTAVVGTEAGYRVDQIGDVFCRYRTAMVDRDAINAVVQFQHLLDAVRGFAHMLPAQFHSCTVDELRALCDQRPGMRAAMRIALGRDIYTENECC